MIYRGAIDTVRLDNSMFMWRIHKADTTFALKLSPAVIDGNPFLQSEPGKLRFKNQDVGYLLGKRDSDTTNMPPKGQRKVVTVMVQPPPPVEPKKN